MQLEVITRYPEQRRFETPLLFVHGAWHGAWCWDEHFLGWFAQRGFEVHALSLRGHGNSAGHEKIRLQHSIGDYVKDVAEVADSLASPPVILGHSMGGFVAQKYLQKHRAPAAVLLAAAPPHGALPFVLRYTRRHPIITLRSLFGLNFYTLIGSPELAREAFFSASLSEAELARYFERMQQESYRAALDVMALNLPRPKRIKSTPMLVIGAEKDAIFTAKEVQKTAAAYNAECEIIPNIAHDVMLDPGWQTVCEPIARWLESRIN